jgi:hypothetical protein
MLRQVVAGVLCSVCYVLRQRRAKCSRNYLFLASLEVSVAALTIRLRSARPNYLSQRIVRSTSFSFQLDGIPTFNEDDEKRPPSSVLELKKCIRRRCSF